jgi:hypothetical protein
MVRISEIERFDRWQWRDRAACFERGEDLSATCPKLLRPRQVIPGVATTPAELVVGRRERDAVTPPIG